jgi:hypothetical protein
MDQMKDLEEENELLNQDLNKLRQEYATVFDKVIYIYIYIMYTLQAVM